MKYSLLKRTIAACLAILLTAPASQAFASSPQSANQNASQSQTPALPAAPAPEAAQSDAPQNPANPAPAASAQRPGNKPVGTAVAPYEETSGVTGSRPAGAVIAPAKQRRVRSILIKIGVVVGAAAAVGAVVALSHGSPSQPPH